MELTQQVRDLAGAQTAAQGMAQKSREFREKGSAIYLKE